jgi:hypothetical protein
MIESRIFRRIIKTLTGSRLSKGDIDDLHLKILNETIRPPRAPAKTRGTGPGVRNRKVARSSKTPKETPS